MGEERNAVDVVVRYALILASPVAVAVLCGTCPIKTAAVAVLGLRVLQEIADLWGEGNSLPYRALLLMAGLLGHLVPFGFAVWGPA